MTQSVQKYIIVSPNHLILSLTPYQGGGNFVQLVGSPQERYIIHLANGTSSYFDNQEKHQILQALLFLSLNPSPESKVKVARDNKRGLHILSNFESQCTALLASYERFKQFIDLQVDDLKLSKVGEAYHNFPGGGFTAVVCLAESHLSIHTWPDNSYATFDVYLSNHTQDNSAKAEAIYASVLQYFSATVLYENLVNR